MSTYRDRTALAIDDLCSYSPTNIDAPTFWACLYLRCDVLLDRCVQEATSLGFPIVDNPRSDKPNHSQIVKEIRDRHFSSNGEPRSRATALNQIFYLVSKLSDICSDHQQNFDY